MDSEQLKDEIKENVKDVNRWIRGFFLLVFLVILWTVKVITGFIVLFQFINSLLTGETNQRLQHWGRVLAEYYREIVLFLTYNSEYRPFPFNDLPQADAMAEASEATKPAAKKKASRKKKAARKKSQPEADTSTEAAPGTEPESAPEQQDTPGTPEADKS